MKNKYRIFQGLAVVGLLIGGFGAPSAFADTAQSITAKVTPNCSPVLRTFVVPAGKTAQDFDIDGFASGYNCGTGASISQSGFDIHYGACPNPRYDGDVYWYRKNGSSSQKSMSISNLTINEGTYCLSFDGGKEGYVRLNYKLK